MYVIYIIIIMLLHRWLKMEIDMQGVGEKRGGGGVVDGIYKGRVGKWER